MWVRFADSRLYARTEALLHSFDDKLHAAIVSELAEMLALSSAMPSPLRGRTDHIGWARISASPTLPSTRGSGSSAFFGDISASTCRSSFPVSRRVATVAAAIPCARSTARRVLPGSISLDFQLRVDMAMGVATRLHATAAAPATSHPRRRSAGPPQARRREIVFHAQGMARPCCAPDHAAPSSLRSSSASMRCDGVGLSHLKSLKRLVPSFR